MRRLEDKAWWADLIKDKDDYSLRELGEKYGATPGAINGALKRNGIERKGAPPGPRKNRSRPAKGKVGAPRGPRKATLSKLEPYLAKLGKVTDRVIAEEAGVSVQTVAAVRKHMGITVPRGRRPANPPETTASTTAAKKNPGPGRSAIAPYADHLGQVPDSEIAALAGVSENAVRNYRNRRGISAPPRMPSSASATPAPKKARPAAPKAAPAVAAVAVRAGAQAWRVQLDGRSVIVVGDSAVEAATKASAAGTVTSMELLGEVLG